MFCILFYSLVVTCAFSQNITKVKEFSTYHFYFEFEDFANYEEATEICNKYNASLLIINNKAVDTFVHDTLRNSIITSPLLFYIGLVRVTTEQYGFEWLDGTVPLDTSLWRRNEPRDQGFPGSENSCVAIDISTAPLSSTGTYRPAMLTCECSAKLHYICRSRDNPIVASTVNVTRNATTTFIVTSNTTQLTSSISSTTQPRVPGLAVAGVLAGVATIFATLIAIYGYFFKKNQKEKPIYSQKSDDESDEKDSSDG